jgi:hypothetical protein
MNNLLTVSALSLFPPTLSSPLNRPLPWSHRAGFLQLLRRVAGGIRYASSRSGRAGLLAASPPARASSSWRNRRSASSSSRPAALDRVQRRRWSDWWGKGLLKRRGVTWKMPRKESS